MPDPAAPTPPPRPPSRLSRLIEEYGPWAVGTYLVIWLGTWAAFAIAIPFRDQGTGGFLAAVGAAWVATKATQPIRIAISLALTPLVARLFGRRRKVPAGDADAGKQG